MLYHFLAQAGPSGVDGMLTPERLTLAGVLFLLVIAFMKGWIVAGPTHQAERDRADRMERRAFQQIDTVRSAVDTVDKTATAIIEHQKRRER